MYKQDQTGGMATRDIEELNIYSQRTKKSGYTFVHLQINN